MTAACCGTPYACLDMPRAAWHARLRPRSWASLRRVTRLSEAAEHTDSLTKEPLDPLASFAVTSDYGAPSRAYYYNATTLVQCGSSGWLAEPFTGLRLRRADEERVRRAVASSPRPRRAPLPWRAEVTAA